tara:strand:+ start:1871 stop:2188 length:318 start_codon:yes stop_codon:yes gene_type:complete
MIDTDKYEGHLMDGDFQVWRWSSKMIKVANYEEQMATAELLRDTPLLLAEVKRLRWGIYFALSYTRPTPHTADPWVACRKAIVKYLESLIADIEPLSFIPKGEEE